ncbi:MAG: lasso peptide biosynthesis B2 protein, partial [Chitinophagaceae bacterium]|nr:lasso peptide biosynthesis B2 protein [Chitinophagaceae bacterium]
MYRRFLTLFYFLEVIVISAIVRFTLSYLAASFRLRWMGKSIPSDSVMLTSISENDISMECREKLIRVKTAVARCNRYAPWNTECLTQALTAKQMLRRRKLNSLLFIGFKKDAEGEIGGHAWLKV